MPKTNVSCWYAHVYSPVQEVNLESTSVTAEMMVAMKDSAQAMAGVHKKM